MAGTRSGEIQENLGNVRLERKDFIERKFRKLEKDRKYGFPLSELENKIRKKHFGNLVNKLKTGTTQPDKHDCHFCESHKLSDFKIATSKVEKLIQSDYDKLKHRSDLEKVCEENQQEKEYSDALKGISDAIETRNYISSATFKLKYKLIYGDAPPDDLF